MRKTQVIIVGGGLAGLTAAIHLTRSGLQVTLIEKENYPHHKVCGEYLSREVLPYLRSLDIDLDILQAPTIRRMEFSSISGKTIGCELKMGGIGISRYTLDNLLFEKAKEVGCEVISATATSVKYEKDQFEVVIDNDEKLTSDFVLGAFGKRSNLDKELNREFIQHRSGWLAVKAHYRTSKDYYPEDLVSLHNFEGGYCGLSKTELESINVCYLATYSSFKNYKNTTDFKEKVLMRNPNLKEFFQNAEMIFDKELTIAQVNFDKKSLIQDHILMIGDSAGLIHPLCGNGMAMAIHSSKIASEILLNFYNKKRLGREELEKQYNEEWNGVFRSRLRSGRILQKILLNKTASEISQSLLNSFPGLLPDIIKRTHGKLIYA